eukprot:scaffold8359_cov162-Pinguiococcus_pyrenoidosus.AAC.1
MLLRELVGPKEPPSSKRPAIPRPKRKKKGRRQRKLSTPNSSTPSEATSSQTTPRQKLRQRADVDGKERLASRPAATLAWPSPRGKHSGTDREEV